MVKMPSDIIERWKASAW